MNWRWLSGIAATFVLAGSAHTTTFNATTAIQAALNRDLQTSRTLAMVADIVDWKVGEWQTYKVSLGFFGDGLMEKTVASEEGDAIWVNSVINILGQKVDQQMLIRRADGQLLKLIVNGEEKKIDEEGEQPEIEILDQGQKDVKVPAGTFVKAFYVKIKMKSSEGETVSELWIAPKGHATPVNMEGLVKMVAEQQFGELTLELKAFGIK